MHAFARGKQMIAAAARKLEPARVDPVRFREHIVNALLIAATFGTILVSLSMATIAFELNLIRISEHQAVVDLEHAITSRVDTLLWKTDTFLTTFKETNKNLSHGLTDVRVQVKQAQDVQSKTTRELSRMTTAAVRESLKVTSEVVQAVADKPPAQVEVTGPAPVVKVDGPIPVRITPPSTVISSLPAKPAVPEPEPAKKKRWFHLWLF
jgi:histone acetyltransferase (RNA polymerase elongator complex component)